MASVATTRLRLDKQATGDNPNAWGIRLNAALDLIDESQGVSIVPVSADVTLTSNNYTSDQARRAVLRFTGAGGFTVTVPAVEKLYLIDNRCAADVTLKTASGASAVIRAGTRVPAYVDAVDTTAVDPTLDKIKPAAAAVNLNGQRLTNGGAAVDDTDFIQKVQATGLVAPLVTLAQSWATQLTGEVVIGQGYSARFNANLSKAWATQASGEVVAGQGFSSFYYAGLSAGSASASATSAGNSAGSATLSMNWATSLSLVDAIYFGARKYAIDAAASAQAAAQFDPSSYYVKSIVDAKDAEIRRLASLAIALGG